MPRSDLARRLLLVPDAEVLVLNPPAGYLDRLGVTPAATSEPTDFVQLFVRDRAQLEREAPAALQRLKSGGVLWVVYPSPASGTAADLSRDHGWGALNALGFVAGSRQVIDGDWDALRFLPASELPQARVPAADMLPVGRHATPTYRLVRLIATPIFHLLFRFDLSGREHVPDTAFVAIANHLGWMDAISLLLLLPAEPRIHFLADPGSMMRNRPLWALVKLTGGIVPVDRARRGDRLLFRHVGRCLELGGAVALFPEGDFGPREGTLLPFKRGFAHFAVDGGVPVLPVALSGMKEVWLGKSLTVRIGKPIPSLGRTVDEVHQLGEAAVRDLLPAYQEPRGRKPLRRWLTGLF